MDAHGGSQSESLMALFERYLDNGSSGSGGAKGAAEDEENFDRVREGVVVLLGTLARHMTSQDDKVLHKADKAPSITCFMWLSC